MVVLVLVLVLSLSARRVNQTVEMVALDVLVVEASLVVPCVVVVAVGRSLV